MIIIIIPLILFAIWYVSAKKSRSSLNSTIQKITIGVCMSLVLIEVFAIWARFIAPQYVVKEINGDEIYRTWIYEKALKVYYEEKEKRKNSNIILLDEDWGNSLWEDVGSIEDKEKAINSEITIPDSWSVVGLWKLDKTTKVIIYEEEGHFYMNWARKDYQWRDKDEMIEYILDGNRAFRYKDSEFGGAEGYYQIIDGKLLEKASDGSGEACWMDPLFSNDEEYRDYIFENLNLDSLMLTIYSNKESFHRYISHIGNRSVFSKYSKEGKARIITVHCGGTICSGTSYIFYKKDDGSFVLKKIAYMKPAEEGGMQYPALYTNILDCEDGYYALGRFSFSSTDNVFQDTLFISKEFLNSDQFSYD